jgi:hypothetical protein
MATYYLMNSIQFQGTTLQAGRFINDVVDDVTALQAAGAWLIDSSTAGLEAASLIAQKHWFKDGAADSIMQAALNSHQETVIGTLGARVTALESGTVQLTSDGGFAIPIINKTGAASIKGTVVSASGALDNAFIAQSVEYDSIGIVYENGVADGDECLVVVGGKAKVLLQNGIGTLAGFWVRASSVDGRAYAASAPSGGFPGATDEHFKEIGHCLETVTGGTDKLCLCLLHFN